MRRTPCVGMLGSCLALAGCGGEAIADAAALDAASVVDVPDAGAGTHDAGTLDAGGTPSVHCALDPSCPELTIEGDPPAVSPFRGYGDPSLERDPTTGALWLSYSWLEAQVVGTADADLTVVTHLARSDDAGRTFTFVRAINATEVVDSPSGTGRGWWFHEVSTLARGADDWRLVTLDYLDPVGAGERAYLHFARTTAAEPTGLGDATERWLGVSSSLAPLTVRHDVASIAGLEDCAVLTEPALLHHEGTDYVAASCVVVDASGRHPERERIELLRETSDGLVRVGPLFDAADAAGLGVDRLEQLDLSIARDGTPIAIVTPIVDGGDPMHRGCVAYELEDLASARVRRDADGHAIPRVRITADGTVFGPGLCTYDAASESGVLLVITDFDLSISPPRLRFSLRATGIHP
ncbi:MAG: sialidase family protein [Sandaracinus sp.]